MGQSCTNPHLVALASPMSCTSECHTRINSWHKPTLAKPRPLPPTHKSRSARKKYFARLFLIGIFVHIFFFISHNFLPVFQWKPPQNNIFGGGGGLNTFVFYFQYLVKKSRKTLTRMNIFYTFFHCIQKAFLKNQLQQHHHIHIL